MKQVAVTFLFLILYSFSFAQVFNNPSFESEVQKGLDLMYNMQYDAADRIFSSIQQKYPDHPAPYFMKALNRWWQTYISVQTDTYYDFIEQQLELAIDKNKVIAHNEALEKEHTFFAFMNYALLSRLHAYQGEYFSAIGSARKVISPLKKSIKFVGTQAEFYMVAGIYHYYAATYADFYPVVRPLMYFFPDGDKELGLRELEMARDNPSFAQIEAAFFLGYIYLDELPDVRKGLVVTKELFQRYPKNTWFETDYGRALLLNKRYQEGEQVIDRLIGSYESQSGHRSRNITSLSSRHTTHLIFKVYHYKGYAALFHHKDYLKAIQFFELSDEMAKLAKVEEDFYLAGNRYFIGVCYDNLGQRGKAIQAYEETLDMDDNYFYKEGAKQNLKEPHLLDQ